MSDRFCPFCNASLKCKVPERVIRPIGQKAIDESEAGHREEFVCGAIVLTNRQNPFGTVEAKCCVPLSQTSAQAS